MKDVPDGRCRDREMSTCAAHGVHTIDHVLWVARARAYSRARVKSARVDDRPPRARFGSAYSPQVDDLMPRERPTGRA